jgi:uncharacterized protein YigA (DUF484 family)
MTDVVFSAQEIADFLVKNPQFFTTHAEVFTTLAIPHPHGAQAISLGERQVRVLRERNRELEWRLGMLANNASANEKISNHIVQWCRRLLSQSDPQRLPSEITLGLTEQFQIQHVALRLWGVLESAQQGAGAPASQNVRAFVDSLQAPYCGDDTDFEAVAWLDVKPRSLALVPLRLEGERASVGLLVLGSEDPGHFTAEMGTTLLESMGLLAAAALQRLHTTAPTL